MWHASHHWLPTLAYLDKRGVPANGLYPRCHSQNETMSHALWGCRALLTVRARCSFSKKLVFIDGMHFHDFMLDCSQSLRSYEVELLCVIFWRLWFCRNQLVHNLGNLDLGEVVNWATIYLDEWRSIHFVDSVSTSRNGDASGKVKMAAVRKLTAMVSLVVAEALAVNCGIQMAMEAGLVPFQIETDSLQVVNLMRAGSSTFEDVSPIIDEISGFLRSMPCSSIDHISGMETMWLIL
ncbi:hypothetical protein Dsin_029978 [Dipteronia sinensis]|uniref:RNase H type-1 domain-containing protein n=1 Tax=Dipteronia sinensis TaxID=43782 RepID=A0AAD9ZIH8_9ROSI|nr:hypothetical protein Dsin_029978 [Dipteronia sinensis]